MIFVDTSVWVAFLRGRDTVLVDEWVDCGARSSQRFGVMDLLIGALAAQQNAAPWSPDRDFERMARLGLVDRYQPS